MGKFGLLEYIRITKANISETRVGCYYCVKSGVDVSQVREWVDSDTTPLCPECGIDALVVDTGIENLSQMYRIAFTDWIDI